MSDLLDSVEKHHTVTGRLLAMAERHHPESRKLVASAEEEHAETGRAIKRLRRAIVAMDAAPGETSLTM